MKKILIILLILPIFLFAELNIPKVSNALAGIKSKTSSKLNFYTTNTKIKSKGKLKFTSSKKADIIVLSKTSDTTKMLIVNSYKDLKVNKNSIGAIYLKKGRTQIVFVEERLAKNGLVLSPRFSKHLIHTWQLNPVALLNNIK